MKARLFLLSLLFFMPLSTQAQVAWNQKCLDDCFSTGHECKYCAWQCSIDDGLRTTRRYYNSPCPLNGHINDNNNYRENYENY